MENSQLPLLTPQHKSSESYPSRRALREQIPATGRHASPELIDSPQLRLTPQEPVAPLAPAASISAVAMKNEVSVDTKPLPLARPIPHSSSRKTRGKCHGPLARLSVVLAAAAMLWPVAIPSYANGVNDFDSNNGQNATTQLLTGVNSDGDAGLAESINDRGGISVGSASASSGNANRVVCRLTTGSVSGEVSLPLPADTYDLTSGIGYRYIPELHRSDYHTGQDFAAPIGVSILAVASGTITDIGTTEGAWFIKEHSVLSSGEAVDFYYVHMFSTGILVKVGDTVTAGHEIALVGQSGVTTGPHLHLEVHDASKGDTQVAERSTLLDPLAWLTSHAAQSPGRCY